MDVRGTPRRRRWFWPAAASAAAAPRAYARLIRPRLSRWGATDEEAHEPLPGDELVPAASYATTRAITVRAPAAAVWPWLVQLGQGRGGFYTYDRLERLAGAAIRSADRVVPEWQHPAVGDRVLLSPVGGPAVVRLEPGRALVLRDTMDVLTGRSVPPGGRAQCAMDWSWSFTLRPAGDGARRLPVRTRAAFRPRALLAPAAALLLEPAHFVMEWGMLPGIARRAEGAGVAPPRAALA